MRLCFMFLLYFSQCLRDLLIDYRVGINFYSGINCWYIRFSRKDLTFYFAKLMVG